MKKLIGLIILALVITGCSTTGYVIGKDPNSQALGYVTGKGLGLAINKFAPKSSTGLEAAWKAMMEKNAAVDPIPGAEMVLFYNQSILTLAGEVKDPYGLIGDLTALATIYGAQYNADKQMILMQDIPKIVANYFQLGYTSGKSLALAK